MKLTPLDISKQEFKRSLRGYDPEEVDAFLEMVSDEFERMIRENKGSSDEGLILRTQLKDYQDVESTLKETLMSAQQSISDSKETSSREAEIIIREAELRSEKILEDTRLRLAKMKNEIVVLRAQKDSFAKRLRHLLESQIELIEVLSMDDIGFDKQYRKRSNVASNRERQEEEIEFEAFDEALVEDRAENARTENLQADRQENLDWPKQEMEVADEKQPREDRSKNSRISDQLII